MNRITTYTLVGALLLATGVTAVTKLAAEDPMPEVPAVTHTSPVQLVLARPFTLDTPYVYSWRSERPQVSAGVALVLQVADPALIHPRQGYEPVLYVGAQTAQRLNVGHESGHLVVIVPAGVDADGNVDLDLTTAPIFFGDPELPERIDAAAAQAQLGKALSAGVQASSATVIENAMQDQVRFTDDWELTVWAADLIESYSPQEVDLVSGLRAQRVGR
jgi:hypothetical protein